MNRQEFKKQKEGLYNKYLLELEELYTKCASENCSIKIGDIVTDNFHSIKVESMEAIIRFNESFPEFKFYGTGCKKDGTITKRPNNDPVFQSNIKFVNGKKYTYTDDLKE